MLEAAREKHHWWREITNWMILISHKKTESKRQRGTIFKAMKEKIKDQPWILYLAKISFRKEGKIKAFLIMENRKVVATRFALQKC